MQFVPTAHHKADILTKGLTDFDSRSVMACEDAWDSPHFSGLCTWTMFQTFIVN